MIETLLKDVDEIDNEKEGVRIKSNLLTKNGKGTSDKVGQKRKRTGE